MRKLIFKLFGVTNYLRILQKGFFLSYNLGFLKSSPSYTYNYFDKKLIQKGDVVIDIGANLGYYTRLFSNWVGKTGKVYAIEPIALYNKILKEGTKGRSNITMMPYALGLEEKEITLVTSSQAGYLRTGLPHVYDKKRDGDFDQDMFKFKAQMRIPSELFKSLDRIDFIKCDIEGFEYTVLSNISHIIDRHKPKVQVEVWGDNEKPMIDMFTDLNYTAYKLDNGKLTSDRTRMKEIRNDYLFIHKDDLLAKELMW